ncbi:MAG: 50S ribosomal protein L13 [Candidatus Bipolaricaulia bacterium]
MQRQPSYMAKKEEMGETWERKWHLIDARGKILGRLASEIATILQGKHKPIYTPHVDTGDYVIVINAREIELTGKKREQKKYYHHTGYIGHLKEKTYEELVEKHPTWPIEKAVKNMLPKSKLGRRMFKKLKVYPGPEHPHEAQQPEPLDI